MENDTYYIEHKGHRFAICAVPYKSFQDADKMARLTCGDAMRTDIIFVAKGNYSGNIIKSLNRDGTEIQLD